MTITFASCADVLLFQTDGGGWLPAIIYTTPPAPAVDIGWSGVGAGATVSLAKNAPPTIAPWVEVGVINFPDTEVRRLAWNVIFCPICFEDA